MSVLCAGTSDLQVAEEAAITLGKALVLDLFECTQARVFVSRNWGASRRAFI